MKYIIDFSNNKDQLINIKLEMLNKSNEVSQFISELINIEKYISVY